MYFNNEVVLIIYILFVQLNVVLLYTRISNDYDWYGIKVGMNDNLNIVLYVVPVVSNNNLL
jgi:hypothetical protein